MLVAVPSPGHEFLRRIDELLPAAADPSRAPAARAYMRDQFPFLGVSSPRVQAAVREALVGLAPPSEADLVTVGRGGWRRAEREYQYAACAYLRRFVRRASPGLLPVVGELIVSRSWWDTVDTLAAHTVGGLVADHPALVSTMDTWSVDGNLWLVRTALLHQLRYKDRTDVDRLFGYCLTQPGHRDFFIRKAIGWALREYAKTDPAAVRSFVDAHRTRLAPLSVREALKNVTS